jgi:hypothetical protein
MAEIITPRPAEKPTPESSISMGEDGMRRHRRGGPRPEGWASRLNEFQELWNRDGKWRHKTDAEWTVGLEESIGTDDFPEVFGDSLDRALLARYAGLGRPLDPIFMKKTLKDFRTAKVFRIDGSVKRLQVVGEYGVYGETPRLESKYELLLKKYGKRFRFSFEAFKNDDLGIFDDVPADLAESAVNTEAWLQTATFWDANGPLDAFFAHATEGQGGVSSNALSVANLGAAAAAMRGNASGFRNNEGEPFNNEPGFLVVGPALEYTARQILDSTEVEHVLTGSTDVARAEFGKKNTVGTTLNLMLIVDPWIPVVVTTGTLANTTWALFSRTVSPGAFGRPQWSEAPELFMKGPDQSRVGGGATSPFDGSFESDDIQYKVRHGADTVALDPRGGWASDGQ